MEFACQLTTPRVNSQSSGTNFNRRAIQRHRSKRQLARSSQLTVLLIQRSPSDSHLNRREKSCNELRRPN